MRKLTTILLLSCSMLSMALVPPRDPSRRAEWLALYNEMQEQMRQAEQQGVAKLPTATQVVGTRKLYPRIPVIMVNFQNERLLSTMEEVDSMFNGYHWTKGGATGSIRQYFYDQSMGEYNPRFDIIGSITLSRNYQSYGGVTNGVGTMLLEVMDSVAKRVSSLDMYDDDNDGILDLVYVYYAGYGKNDPPTTDTIETSKLVWPAYYSGVPGGDKNKTFLGKRLESFEFSNELDGVLSTTMQKSVVAGIGVSCHEFCHALGLPDLYETNSGNDTHNCKLLGKWDIMDYGPYNNNMHTPPSFSAYERFFMGWLTPTLITDADNLQLEHIATSNKAYLITESDEHNLSGISPYPNVFYLLENRQKTGWDLDVPGEGMLITRINYRSTWWRGNTVNNSANNLGVDIIEADGKTPDINTADGAYGKPGDAFPYGATEYLGITDHAITDITMTDGVVSFKYRGGKPIDPTSDVTPTVNASDTYKSLVNGQLLIHAGGCTYSVLGIRQD